MILATIVHDLKHLVEAGQTWIHMWQHLHDLEESWAVLLDCEGPRRF